MGMNMYVALVLSLCVTGMEESVLTDQKSKHDIGIGMALVHNLYDLTKDVLDINDRLRIMENALPQSDSGLTKSELNITDRMIVMENKLQSCQEETKLLKQKQALKRTVSFMARPMQNFKCVAGAKVKFDDIVTNEGNAYNISTSTFTAPVKGSYFFGLSIGMATPSKASDYLRIHIQKNGVPSSYLFIGPEGLWTKRSENVVLHLKKDDTVNVKIGTAPAQFKEIAAHSHSQFYGFLIN